MKTFKLSYQTQLNTLIFILLTLFTLPVVAGLKADDFSGKREHEHRIADDTLHQVYAESVHFCNQPMMTLFSNSESMLNLGYRFNVSTHVISGTASDCQHFPHLSELVSLSNNATRAPEYLQAHAAKQAESVSEKVDLIDLFQQIFLSKSGNTVSIKAVDLPVPAAAWGFLSCSLAFLALQRKRKRF